MPFILFFVSTLHIVPPPLDTIAVIVYAVLFFPRRSFLEESLVDLSEVQESVFVGGAIHHSSWNHKIRTRHCLYCGRPFGPGKLSFSDVLREWLEVMRGS
jgi:hypothetical protein